MARSIQQKTNTDAATGTYPYGNIRDNDGSNNGTPVNVETYGDFHQFFEALMADAGITFNGLPDNLTNGFQLYLAFVAAVRNKQATTTALGTAEIATDAEVQAGTDTERMVTPANLVSRTATETRTGIAEIATQTEMNTGSDDARMVTALKIKTSPEVVGFDGATKLRIKIVEIGDWNMDSTTTVQITHGIADWTKIRSVRAGIRTDADTSVKDINRVDPSTGAVAGSVEGWDSANVVLQRTTGGHFDSNAYDSTTFNRGWITIEYIG